MPGPPGQRFLPNVPFGLALGPQGTLVADVPTPVQTTATLGPALPLQVRRATPSGGLQRRTPIPAHTAEPIVAKPFVVPSATIVTDQSLQRSLTRRTVPLRSLVAEPIVSPPFVPPVVPPPPPTPFLVTQVVSRAPRHRRGVSQFVVRTLYAAPLPVGEFNSQATQRALTRRSVPPPHLAEPIVAPAAPFIAPPATIVSSHVLRRPRRTIPPSTILPPPFVAPTFAPPKATIVATSGDRRYRRRYVPSTILPTGAPPQPPVPLGEFNYQATQRALTRRSVPAPHVAEPVTQTSFVAPPATVVGRQARERATTRRTAFRSQVRFGPPLPPVPTGTFVLQAVERAVRRRSGSVRLPSLGGRPPVPIGEFSYQAVQRPLTRRTVPAPHIAEPIATPLSTFVAPPATIVLQAAERAVRRRSGSVRIPSLGALPPVREGTFSYQAAQRPLARRTVPVPHLAEPIVTSPSTFVAPPATIVTDQSVARALTRRTVPAPHLPKLGTSRPVPSGTFVSQATERTLTRRTGPPRPHLAQPIVAAAVPFRSFGFYSFQAVERAQERRYRDVAPEPHLAAPVKALAGPGATIKLQSLARQLRRREGRVLLPELGGQRPVPEGTFVSQALQRAQRGRGPFPSPHLAKPIVLVTPFLAPRPIIVSQAIGRGYASRSRSVPEPHVASPVRAPAGPGALLRLQAVTGRALLGRGGHVRLPSLGQLRPVPEGTFVSQALRRPFVGRTAPAPHLAKPVIPPPTQPPVPEGTFVEQAVARSGSLVSRRGRVRVASPVLTKSRVPPTLVVSQALPRQYVGRKVIPPHLARPVLVPKGPGARLYYQAVQRPLTRRSVPLRPRLAKSLVKPPPAPISAFPIVFLQATERAYLGRKVPPSPSVRYRPIVFIPSQPPVPTPRITGTGVTVPQVATGTTAPRETLAHRESLYPSSLLFPSSTLYSDGSFERTLPLGTRAQTKPDGTSGMTAPRGTLAHHGALYPSTTVFPSPTLFPDASFLPLQGGVGLTSPRSEGAK